MRITILNQFYVPDISPTAHLCASLAEYLAGRGHEVTVVASRGGYVAAPSSSKDAGPDGLPQNGPGPGGLRIFRLWTPQLGKSSILKRCIDYATFYTLALWRLLTLPRQDAVIALTTPPYIAWAAIAHRLLHPSAKVILWSMDCYPDAAERLGVLKRGGMTSRFLRWANRAMFRRLDHLICLDTAMRELLISQYGPRKRELPCTTIPNWEKAEFFPRVEPGASPQWSRAGELGILDRFVVLYLGNMGYGHEFDTLLEVAEQLRDEPVSFVFVGGGRRWEELDRAARERNLASIIMSDYVPKEETRAVMASAHCALITLREESLGVMSPSKLHSNLAMSLPVIYIGPVGSNVDDAIEQFACGVSVRTGNTSQVVEFIRANMTLGPGFDQLRSRARLAFEEAYCDHVTMPQFERIVRDLVATENSRPQPVATCSPDQRAG